MDDEILRQKVLDPQLPGVAYMLIWGELSEESEGHRALSRVLFDEESVSSPEDAGNRDLSDPVVRQGVFDCARQFNDVRQACEKILSEITTARNRRPWWKFW
jgi:hypothetical protein